MTDLTKLSLKETRDGLRAKQFSAVEVTSSYLGAIDQANESLNAYICVEGEGAKKQARISDEKLASGNGGALE
ncbi:hypothetical protein MNBD_ALPHA11-47, partial [hydrothermal vent metagenome]